jgi:hypothetical protein
MAFRSGVMADSTNFLKEKSIMFSRQYFSHSYKCIDHHWKIDYVTKYSKKHVIICHPRDLVPMHLMKMLYYAEY